MHKFVPVLALIATVPIWIDVPAAAELHSAGPLSRPFAIDLAGVGAAVVLIAGKGGGMGGGATTGGPGGGSTIGGMGGGATTGGMGSDATTGGMGGGATTGGGMFNGPAANFGTNGSSDWPGNNARPSYYTYQCATPAEGCSFVAPASLRSSSLRAGARCSCSDGLSQGQIK